MHRFLVTAGFVALAGGAATVFAQPPLPPQAVEHRPIVILPDHHDVTPPLRDMPIIPPGREHEESPHAPLPVRGGPKTLPAQQDGALQLAAPTVSAITPAISFGGIGNNDGVLPPDTNGDVGGDYYVQWVNLTYAVYDKKTGANLMTASGRTLWQGFGGACEADNDGDPIVLYDEVSHRWFLSQFALPNYPRGPFYQCIAVSQSDNPTGSFARYSYSFSKMNDYPKFGVWPDGYYMSINQFTNCNIMTCSWGGEGVAVFERDKMLLGQTARMIYIDMASDASLGGMLPADFDGTPPPAGSPEYYMQFDDQPDELQLWEFHANWTTPSASTFTRAKLLPTAAFDSNMCGGSRNCIPQAGTSVKIDAIADRLMYRLQYRNFGDHQSLVTNHTVDVGADRAGVRWYEIRNPGPNATIYQQGTYAPTDGVNRWMASAAMDKDGNLAIGYSVSNSTTFPSIRFTGRRPTDTLGQLPIAESDLLQGTGYQTHSSGRWGDYSMLSVDPSDGCTFWYTTEYYAGASSAGWRTNIGSFRIGSCGSTSTAPAAPSGLTAIARSSSAIHLAWTDNSVDETGFEIARCSGASCSPSVVTTVAANTNAWDDSGLTASTSYTYQVRAINGTLKSAYSNTASATTLSDEQPPAGDTRVWVTALTGASSPNGKNAWRATVTASAGNDDGPAAGVTVQGTWSTGGAGSCVTDSTGTCTITSARLSTRTTSTTTFTVTGMDSATLGYVASKNVLTAVQITHQ
jgi:hypothetical protein